MAKAKLANLNHARKVKLALSLAQLSPSLFLLILSPAECYRMYDVDGNGYIDPDEMVKIVQAIYDMLGAGSVKPVDTAEERAKNIFQR